MSKAARYLSFIDYKHLEATGACIVLKLRGRYRDGYLRFAICLSVIASWACSPGGKARAPDWTRVPVSLELRLAEGSPAPGLVPAAVYGQGKTVYLHPEAQLSNSDIVRVEAVKTRIGKGLILQIWLTRAGASRMKETTGRHIGDSLAVLIDTVVMGNARLWSALSERDQLYAKSDLSNEGGMRLGE